MKLKDKKFELEGIVHLSDVMTALGLHDDEERNAFMTDDIPLMGNGANYTLIDSFTFWKHFIKDSFQVSLSSNEFVQRMSDNGVLWINIDG